MKGARVTGKKKYCQRIDAFKHSCATFAQQETTVFTQLDAMTNHIKLSCQQSQI